MWRPMIISWKFIFNTQSYKDGIFSSSEGLGVSGKIRKTVKLHIFKYIFSRHVRKRSRTRGNHSEMRSSLYCLRIMILITKFMMRHSVIWLLKGVKVLVVVLHHVREGVNSSKPIVFQGVMINYITKVKGPIVACPWVRLKTLWLYLQG